MTHPTLNDLLDALEATTPSQDQRLGKRLADALAAWQAAGCPDPSTPMEVEA